MKLERQIIESERVEEAWVRIKEAKEDLKEKIKEEVKEEEAEEAVAEEAGEAVEESNTGQ